MMQRLSGKLNRGIFESCATFKKHTAEKLAFVLLGLSDLILTVLAVNLGFYEINPLMRLFIQIPVILLTVKLFIPVPYCLAHTRQTAFAFYRPACPDSCLEHNATGSLPGVKP